jgi:hypothetical protein
MPLSYTSQRRTQAANYKTRYSQFPHIFPYYSTSPSLSSWLSCCPPAVPAPEGRCSAAGSEGVGQEAGVISTGEGQGLEAGGAAGRSRFFKLVLGLKLANIILIWIIKEHYFYLLFY